MFDIAGKSALITGASGGIGGAIARALHGAGANVALSGTREESLNTLSSELGENAHVTPADLLDTQSVEGLIGLAEEVIGGVDILVNNAGLTRDMLNLTATFRLSRAVIRGMIKRRWGRIINIASVVGVTGNAGQANYAASKAGMIGMSKSMAQEVASRGITVNCVAPGMIVTAMTDVLSDNQKARILDVVPAGRFGESEEIAAGVLYLASKEASYVTGQTIHINGGMTMV